MVQEPTGTRKDLRILIVRSGVSRCGLPASDVVRVVRDLSYHPVPGSRLHLLGLAQYGGEPLPVLDLHALVEGRISGRRHWSTVILGRGRRRTHSLVGLAVEEVLRVTDLIEPAAPQEKTGLMAEAVDVDGETVKVLNTKLLLGEMTHESGAGDD